MLIIDFILIFFLAFTTAAGLFFGLIRVLGAIFTIAVSIIAAGLLFNDLSVKIQPYVLGNDQLSKVTAFLIIYWLSSFFLSFVVKIVNKIFNLPILRTVNRLLGGLAALLGSILILAVFFYLFNQYAWFDGITAFFSKSQFIPYLIKLGKYISWVIPGI